jgi:virulence-associated protein VapD
MYAIAFDLEISELKKHYGDPYNNAYFEIGKELKAVGFEWTQGSVYLSTDGKDNLTHVYRAINILSRIDWFKKSVRDIRAFKVEDWSDFTAIVKE